MSKKQIYSITQAFKSDDLQKYADIVNDITQNNTKNGSIIQTLEYASALKDLDGTQTALLLSTQKLNNTQIQQTLQLMNLTTAQQYQAMADADLLKSKQSINATNLYTTLQTKLGNEENAKAALISMGLADAIDAENTKTIELTAQKLQSAIASEKLTEEQGAELATLFSVADFLGEQNSSTLPEWLNNLKASASALKIQATDTLNWANSLPFAAKALGGVTLGVTAVIAMYKAYKNHLEEVRQKTDEAATAYQISSSSIDGYVSRYQELQQALTAAKGNEEETYNIKKQMLELQTEINDKYGDEYGKLNLIAEAYKDQTNSIKALNKEEANRFLNENRKGIQSASKKMEKERDYVLSSTMVSLDTPEGQELAKIIKSYTDRGMYTIPTLDGTVQIHLRADAQTAYDTIHEFQTELRNKAKELQNEYLFDSILDFSSNSLEDANAIIDKYGNIYNQALISELVTDDNVSQIYDDALAAVEEYNDAVLRSEDPFNDETVKKARENIRTIEDAISDNKIPEKYHSLFDEILEQADTDIFDTAQHPNSGPNSVISNIANETKDAVAAQLEQIDTTSALTLQEQYLLQTGHKLLELEWNKIEAYAKENEVSAITIRALALLKLQQLDLTNNPIDCSQSIYQLYALATAAGLAGQQMEDISKMNHIQNILDTMKSNGQEGTPAYLALQNQLDTLSAHVSNSTISWTEFNDIVDDFSPNKYSNQIEGLADSQGNLSKSTDAATSSLNKQKESLEEQKSALEEQKQYYDDVAEAINWFYDKQIGKTEDLIDNLEKENELLQGQLDGYDSALSAIDRFYQKEIDAIQEKIDAMDEANKAAERELALEKAKEALQNARNNRTVLQYQKGVGFVYTTDEKAIKEAEENLADAEQDIVRAGLEAEIAQLEQYRQLWADIPNIKKQAEEDAMMVQLLGNEWESILLTGRIENVTAFKDQYTALQTEINSNEQLIASYEEKIAYYESLKQEWDNLLSKYEEDTCIQLLITEFGKDYEKELLNGRTISWQQFAENYAHIKDELDKVTQEIEKIAAQAETYASRISTAASSAKNDLNSLAASTVPQAYTSAPEHAANNGYAIYSSTGDIISHQNNLPIQDTIFFKRMQEIGFTPHFTLSPAVSSFSAPETSHGSILQFYGDLSFPNIHTENDAKLLIQELSALSQKVEQHVRRRS